MPGPIVVGAAVALGKLATKKAIKILKDHGVKAKGGLIRKPKIAIKGY